MGWTSDFIFALSFILITANGHLHSAFLLSFEARITQQALNV